MYERALAHRPLVTKMWTGLVGSSCGDLIAQGMAEEPYDAWRCVPR